jgi:hypothetical protein
MNLLDKTKFLFRKRAKHLHPDGKVLGDWSAKDISPDELVSDDWIRQNTRRVQ